MRAGLQRRLAGQAGTRGERLRRQGCDDQLVKRDVDLTDREAVDDAIRQLNAEQLARRLIQE